MAKHVTIDKKWIYIAIVVVAVIVIFLGIKAFSSNEDEIKPIIIPVTTTQTITTTQPPGILVSGTKTDVIIINKIPERVYVNVTYRVFSQFYHDDYTESKIFEVWPNAQQSFKVYNNGGCLNNECLVMILGFQRVAHK